MRPTATHPTTTHPTTTHPTTTRLTWRDVLATSFVAAAAVLGMLWLTGNAMTGTSTRVLGAVVFGLGWAACTSDKDGLAAVYAPTGSRRAPIAYAVVASLLGLVALVAGIITVAGASKAMLATLVAAMVALWLLATIRHLVTAPARPGRDVP